MWQFSEKKRFCPNWKQFKLEDEWCLCLKRLLQICCECCITEKKTVKFKKKSKNRLKFSVSCHPDYNQPWQMDPQDHSSCSGFIIEGQRILCDADVVTRSLSIQIRKHGDSKKYHAKLQHIGHECDLAILTVNDPKFWKTLNLLNLALFLFCLFVCVCVWERALHFIANLRILKHKFK